MAKDGRAEVAWAEIQVPDPPATLFEELRDILEAGTNDSRKAVWFQVVLNAMTHYEYERDRDSD